MLFSIDEIINYYQTKIKRIKFVIILMLIFSLFTLIIFYAFFKTKEYLVILSIGAFVLSIALIILLLSIIIEFKLLNSNDWLLNEKNKHELKRIILYCKGEYILTENNIYLLKTPYIINYSDILLIYQKYNIYRYFLGKSKASSLSESFRSDQSLIIITKEKKAIRLRNDSRMFLFSDDIKLENSRFFFSNDKKLENILINKNSNILIGDTDANKKILKEKYGMSLDCLKYFG